MFKGICFEEIRYSLNIYVRYMLYILDLVKAYYRDITEIYQRRICLFMGGHEGGTLERGGYPKGLTELPWAR